MPRKSTDNNTTPDAAEEGTAKNKASPLAAAHNLVHAIQDTTQKGIVAPVKHVREHLPGTAKKTDGDNNNDAISKSGDSSNKMTDSDQPPAAADVPRSSVPPDETLATKMDLIVNKKLQGLTVSQFYETVWKEPDLYKNWLMSTGKSDIQVQDWEIVGEPQEVKNGNKSDGGSNNNNNGKPSSPSSSLSYLASTADQPSESTEHAAAAGSQSLFVGDWCKEEYTQKRTVTFEFQRTTHLYTGPPIAHVTHTQWLRYNEDRCILHMQVEMEDVPFSSAFNVQIRWVTTRTQDNGLHVQCGLNVHFKQAVLVASKIRSGTNEETKPTQQSLFEAMKEALNQVSGVEIQEEEAVEDVDDIYRDDNEMVVGFEQDELPPCFFCSAWLSYMMRPKMGAQKRRFARQAYAAQMKMQNLLDVASQRQKNLQKHGNLNVNDVTAEERERWEHIESELTDIHQSLDSLLKLQREIGQQYKEKEQAT